MDFVLEVKNLSFAYKGAKPLFEDLNFSLQKGEIKAIIGESGSGKSTLFELILQNLKPQKGSVRASQLSQVFQDPYSSFHPGYSLMTQIEDVAKTLDMEPYLASLQIERAILKKFPHELSGGQLQRASILRALLMQPSLLLLDEPTSALDNVISLDVMKMLLEHTRDMGVLLITHDMDLARWCSDETIALGAALV